MCPDTAARTWRRVSATAVLGTGAAVLVTLLHSQPLAPGLAILRITGVAMPSMAWSARASALSFAPFLSPVFAVAVPAHTDSLATLAGWNATGARAYLAWSLAGSWLPRRRHQTLAQVNTLRASAGLLQPRADLRGQPAARVDGAAPLPRRWMAQRRCRRVTRRPCRPGSRL